MAKLANAEGGGWRYALPPALAVLVLLVTGCPHNEYEVELKPAGGGMTRTLTYYRADGTNKDTGAPAYSGWDTNEVALIKPWYPVQNRTYEGGRWVFRNTFTNALPNDVGGMGNYTNLATSLGEAGFYVERFRGNDDLAGLAEQRRAAADRLMDLVIGWSKMELGREAGYDQLHRFLDTDFRHDVQNVSEYWWQAQFINRYSTNGEEEFMVRFGQYLVARGYFTMGELPKLAGMISGEDSRPMLGKIQRLVARKLGVAEDAPVPGALAFLADEKSVEKSFDKYLATTREFRTKYRQWERERKRHPEIKPPEPDEMADEVMQAVIPFEYKFFSGSPDHLSVKLSLPSAPTLSNGRWDATAKQVVWDTALMDRTNGLFPPLLFYASWVAADETFQTKHFGKVAVTGDALIQYCLWRGGLDQAQGEEWDRFLERLTPGDGLTNSVEGFRFSDESPSETNRVSGGGRALLNGVFR